MMFGVPPVQLKDVPGYTQLLLFSNGQQLHGELVELTPQAVVWKRPDSSEALHFPREQLHRIVLVPGVIPQPNGFVRPAQANVPRHRPAAAISGESSPATLKLPGADWLFGQVSSADGETLHLTLEKGAKLIIPRRKLEWLNFSPNPTPALAFSGCPLDLEDWRPATFTAEMVDRTARIRGASWIGQAISAPPCFEIGLELPPEAEDSTRLWLQPFAPQINCFTTGTVEIQFGRRQIHRDLFVNRIALQTENYPADALDPAGTKGPTRYRIFYDGKTQRILVFRNGKTVGDWTFAAPKDHENLAESLRNLHVSGICLQHVNVQGTDEPLQLSGFWLRPWNGVVPKDGAEAEPTQEVLYLAGKSPLPGLLQSIAGQEFAFNGESQKCGEGTFLRFGPSPAALEKPLAKVALGQQGQLNVDHVEIRDGHVDCGTAFSDNVEIPQASVQSVSFLSVPAEPGEAEDILVFQNGDELSGQALAVRLDGPVRWRTAAGQELELQSKGIAGIRFAGPPSATRETSAWIAELRNGERLRAALVTMDDKSVQFQHSQLGSLTLDRRDLWRLFPRAGQAVLDGGSEPEAWTREPGRRRDERAPSWKPSPGTWVHFDGTYLLRNRGSVFGMDPEECAGLSQRIPAGLERFEVRFESYGIDAGEANLQIQLAPDGQEFNWQATMTFAQVNLFVFDPRRNQMGPNWREIELTEKLPDLEARRAIRLFVDTKSGTSDLFVNGAHVVRTGQQAGERLPHGQYTVGLVPFGNRVGPCALSNLWIGPWNGELPGRGLPDGPVTSLINGDAVPGATKEIHDGKLTLDAEIGALEVPIKRVQEIDFCDGMAPVRAPSRCRLRDGTVVNLDQFVWADGTLSAHSPTWGDLQLGSGAVSEIIFHPAAPHAPLSTAAKIVAEKGPPDKIRPPRE
jgi:hypothetical protein